ncbi:MAG: hypothetical protein ACI4T5_03250 [Prevotella sp.]
MMDFIGDIGSVKIGINVKRSELLADLRALAYTEADKENDEGHAKHQLMDLCEDGNVERVTRVLNLAAAELTEKLYPYTKKPMICLGSREEENIVNNGSVSNNGSSEGNAEGDSEGNAEGDSEGNAEGSSGGNADGSGRKSVSGSDYKEPEEYRFELNVPQMMSQTTVDYVTLLIHEYMTAKVMEDAMMRLYEGNAAKWQRTAERVVGAITAVINKRCRVMRRSMSVF